MGLFDRLFGKRKNVELQYPHQLVTSRTMKDVIDSESNASVPLAGGWGYGQEDAIVLLVESTDAGIAMEYKLIEYRVYKELNGLDSGKAKYVGISCSDVSQRLMFADGGRRFDVLFYTVKALPIEDYLFLKQDWDSHNGYNDDEEGKNKHYQMREERTIAYKTECHFDISHFFGKF